MPKAAYKRLVALLDVEAKRLYSSAMNVRLSGEDLKIVQELKRHGVQLSEVVRKALRNELERIRSHVDVPALVERIQQLHPTPPDAPQEAYPDTTDRRAMQAYYQRKAVEGHEKASKQ
jgi:hypothetical protein